MENKVIGEKIVSQDIKESSKTIASFKFNTKASSEISGSKIDKFQNFSKGFAIANLSFVSKDHIGEDFMNTLWMLKQQGDTDEEINYFISLINELEIDLIKG